MSSFLEKLRELVIRRGTKAIFDRIFKKAPESSPTKETPPKESKKSHPWNTCPIGEHWVRPHDLTVEVSEKNPDGVTIRNTGCRKNPVRSKKRPVNNYLHSSEIHMIAADHFEQLTGAPSTGKLPYANADKYDVFIRGWTQYWNDIFQIQPPLDPDLVKAFIASESTFNLSPPPQNAGTAGRAWGLLQLTDQTLTALRNPKGELKDHLIEMTQQEASDPNVAICAGVRWLFHKRQLASNRLKKEATWMEGVAEYKNYLKDIISKRNPNPRGMQNIERDYRKLKN